MTRPRDNGKGCREHLGRKGICGKDEADSIDGRPFCGQHLLARQHYTDKQRKKP